jgi:proteasome lid subunit RPN8/RPN11
MARTGERAAMVRALAEEQLIEIVRQAEEGYPEEICGIIIGTPGAPETYRVRQAKNVANLQRQKDTTGYERDARTAYSMDALDIQRIQNEADQTGREVLMFYHSHPDHDAYFSAMDRERALWPSGEPLWPGATYLIVSVRERRACDARYYVWDDARKDFLEVAALLPGRGR